MPSSHFIHLDGPTRHNASRSSNITSAPNLPWNPIGDANKHLLQELEQLYWDGVTQELEALLYTLKNWRRPEYSHIHLAEEDDHFIHGFDTFVDQVNLESRVFAQRVGILKDNWEPAAKEEYIKAMREHALDISVDRHSAILKGAIREKLEERAIEETLRQRTKMLLQGVGFLDIEKLIEHRPPLDSLSFWKRPAIPQLNLIKFSKHWIPIFAPLHCSNCSSIIRGIIFGVLNELQEERRILTNICEDCYREHHYGDQNYVKIYKHCILSEAITPVASRNICRCDWVPHYDNNGRPCVLFPTGKGDQHRSIGGPGGLQCGLLKLGELVAEAKYKGMQTIVTKEGKSKKARSLAEEKHAQEVQEEKKKREKAKEDEKVKKQQGKKPRTVTEMSLHDPTQRTATVGSSVVAQEVEADEDIPFFLRKYTEKYPFGNVHMALRIGPILIENGVSQYVAQRE
jgi:hypothetical protein